MTKLSQHKFAARTQSTMTAATSEKKKKKSLRSNLQMTLIKTTIKN